MDRWRLIIDPPLEGPENMAVDEAILNEARLDGASRPTLRFYGWALPTVSVGYLQDSAPFSSLGLPVVRRITGGRAVLHDIELTYSVVAGHAHAVFSDGITGAYGMISKIIVAALKDVGIDARFSPMYKSANGHRSSACFHSPSRYEILVEGKKLVGSSQRRYKDIFLQHGSILFDVDTSLNARIFEDALLDKMVWMKALKAVELEDFREVLTRRMAEGLNASFDVRGLTSSERYLKENLVANKYSEDSWNLCHGRTKGLVKAGSRSSKLSGMARYGT